jgi:hypothetical protein
MSLIAPQFVCAGRRLRTGPRHADESEPGTLRNVTSGSESRLSLHSSVCRSPPRSFRLPAASDAALVEPHYVFISHPPASRIKASSAIQANRPNILQPVHSRQSQENSTIATARLIPSQMTTCRARHGSCFLRLHSRGFRHHPTLVPHPDGGERPIVKPHSALPERQSAHPGLSLRERYPTLSNAELSSPEGSAPQVSCCCAWSGWCGRRVRGSRD